MENENINSDELLNIIRNARQNALKKVNEELITMYWKVGEYLSAESKKLHLVMDLLIQFPMKFRKRSRVSRDLIVVVCIV